MTETDHKEVQTVLESDVDASSNQNENKIPTTLVHGDVKTTLDVSFSTIKEPRHKEVQIVLVPDVEGELVYQLPAI